MARLPGVAGRGGRRLLCTARVLLLPVVAAHEETGPNAWETGTSQVHVTGRKKRKGPRVTITVMQ